MTETLIEKRHFAFVSPDMLSRVLQTEKALGPASRSVPLLGIVWNGTFLSASPARVSRLGLGLSWSDVTPGVLSHKWGQELPPGQPVAAAAPAEVWENGCRP